MSITLRFLVLLSATVYLAAAPHPAAAQTYAEQSLYTFCGQAACTDGQNPAANVVQGSDGYFYGTTFDGGKSSGIHQDGGGAVYKIKSGNFITLYTFCSQTSCTDGANPTASLVQGTDGNFYGTTTAGGTGGSDNGGTVFKITPTGSLTTLYNFCAQASCTDGATPDAGLVQGTDGNFYGTTSSGGDGSVDQPGGNGTVFKITPSGDLTTLFSFCSKGGYVCADGSKPVASLLQASDGNFYGTTASGGANSGGTIFRITSSGTLTTLYSFCSQTNCTDGDDPSGSLIQATDGSLYGTTEYGGNSNNAGTVFKFASTGALTTLYSFCSQTSCADGSNPQDSLVQGTDGNFYGTTAAGGSDTHDDLGTGTIFKITSSGSLTTLYDFCSQQYCYDGDEPYAGLLQGSDGNFYGTTYEESATDYGVSVGNFYQLSVAPELKPPVQVNLSPSQVAGAGSFTLTYAVTNAASDTLGYCFATNNAGNTVWNGVKSGKTTAQSVALTASTTTGTYTYALTCGGIESGFATLIVKDATVSSLSASPNPATVGQSVTLTATVAHSAGAAMPTGVVNFSVGSTVIGSGTVNSSGVATFSATTNGLPPGSYPVVATYSGDGNYDASTSAATTVTLNKAPTTTTLTASPNPVTPPLNVTLTATVARSASGAAGIPTGTMTFYYQTTALGTVGLNGSGIATVTAGSEGLAAGKYPITAKYNGDASDAASSSSAVTVTVK